jgi:hypothetical protein
LSSHGNVKGNRGAGQSVWTPEAVCPSGLTLTLISGGVKIDWVEDTGGTEIWGKIDSGAYAKLYTIAEGTETKDDIRNAEVLMTYKLCNTGSSVFTPEVSIAMLGPELIDQANWAKAAYWSSVGASVTFDDVKITVGNGWVTYVTKDNFWNNTWTYRSIITLTAGNSSWMYEPYSTAGVLVQAPGTFVHYFAPITIQTFVMSGCGYTGNITALSIRRVLVP